jgi:hypothetical protein
MPSSLVSVWPVKHCPSSYYPSVCVGNHSLTEAGILLEVWKLRQREVSHRDGRLCLLAPAGMRDGSHWVSLLHASSPTSTLTSERASSRATQTWGPSQDSGQPVHPAIYTGGGKFDSDAPPLSFTGWLWPWKPCAQKGGH